MAEDAAPPTGPSLGHEGVQASQYRNRDSHDVGDMSVPNLCDLQGLLRVTVSAVRNIPMVMPATTTSEGGERPRRGQRGVFGSPYLKMQVGLHQFQTMEPTLVSPQEASESQGDAPELEWGETLTFELSGDMRGLNIFLMDWMRPFADGPHGSVSVPMGELVNRKWAGATRTLTKFLVTGKDEAPVKSRDDQYTNMEIKIVYEPGSGLMFDNNPAQETTCILHSGVMMTCELCRRWVFVTSRPTPSLEKKARKVKSQRKILLWLRDYTIHGMMHADKLEVPRSTFALPGFVFGPEARFPASVRKVITVLLQDQALKKRLKAIKVLNHNRMLNTWSPIYCSTECQGDGLVEAVSMVVWGTQDMGSRLALEIQQEFIDKHDKFLHLWRKAHQNSNPNHDEHETRHAWEKLKEEMEQGRGFSYETNLMRLLVLAHVLHRPLVVHSDEAPHPDGQTEAKNSCEIPIFGHFQASAEGRELGLIRGIYLPMLHAKPLLLESNRSNYRPPVPLVFSSQTRSFQSLAAQEGEETDLFEVLPWPPLLPLFSGQRLLPLPFTLVNTQTDEGSTKGEKFVRKFVVCKDISMSQQLVLPFGVPPDGKLLPSEKVRCVALAPLDMAGCPPTLFPLLKRYLVLVHHFHLAAQLHEAQELSNMEMTEYMATERPWQQLPLEDEVDACRETFANGKHSQMDSPERHRLGARGKEILLQQRLAAFFHACMREASPVQLAEIDCALSVVREVEETVR